MTQDLARIRAFVQVFDSGGFSAAARQHGRSKALLSKYVTDLEDYLGVRLMNRTTRKLSLTEAGEAYYREASQLLQQLDDLDASISDQTTAPRGLLRVSAPRNFGERTLAPAIFEFLLKFPEVSLDLRLEDRYVDLVDEGIDVALRLEDLRHMRVAVDCEPVGTRRNNRIQRTPESLQRLVRQAIDEIDVDRAESRFAACFDNAECLLDALEAVDGLLHLRVEVLHP